MEGPFVLYGYIFLAFGLATLHISLQQGSVAWFWLWPTLSFLLLFLGSLFGGSRLTGKRPDGSLPLLRIALFFPYISVSYGLWWLLAKFGPKPDFHQLSEKIWIGRRLFPEEYPEEITCVIDLTSEYPASLPKRPIRYINLPILDAGVPPEDKLLETIAKLDDKDVLYIHCALGRGRTSLFASILLLEKGWASTPEEAFQQVKQKRPSVRLNRGQQRYLDRFFASRYPKG
ncbi:MAG: dual specificity protein phosphatase family protein [Myxococcales bacterium]|nr:dual specificity protein phosphatase family protein [Myxococcales bacterium]MCB9642305.1 dual specificity protein phosphatase family protein [Myxococcales bacterium]